MRRSMTLLTFSAALAAGLPGMTSGPGIFAVAGMAGLLAATVGAPLTGAMLVAEMSGNYLLLPMMLVVAAVASVVAGSLGCRPIYDVLLERTLRSPAPVKVEP